MRTEPGQQAASELHFFGRSLLVAEAVVTMLLLTSAGMVVHNFYNLQRARLGFVPENTMTAQINLANVDANHRKAKSEDCAASAFREAVESCVASFRFSLASQGIPKAATINQ